MAIAMPDDRIDDVPVRVADDHSRNHDADRYQGVGHQVKVSALDVQVTLFILEEQEGGERVDQDPHARDPDDYPGRRSAADCAASRCFRPG